MLKQDRLPLQKKHAMRNSRSNNRGPKKAGTTNRFAEGSRGPRSLDNDDRAGAGKKEFKGGAANFKRVKRRSAEISPVQAGKCA